MKKFIRKHKTFAFSVLGTFVLIAALIEVWVGWDTVLIWAGFKPAPATVEGTMEVHFIDVGNADCILVRQADQAMLIDAGERGDANVILSYLSEHGVKKLDLVIATHPHADHIGSMAKIVNKVSVKKFVMSYMPESATPTTATYEQMLEALDRRNVPIEEAVPGNSYAIGDAQVQILAPLQETDETNDISVVTKLVFGETSFLLTGDAGTAVERQLIQSRADLKADVLKLSHHGSSTGNSLSFLKKVSPDYAVITCGLDNDYGHPHKEVMERLKKLKIQPFRADVYGTMVFLSDGKTITSLPKKE